MNVKTECPGCGIENRCAYQYGKEVYPFKCCKCGLVYVVSIEPNGPIVETINILDQKKVFGELVSKSGMKPQIPELPNGTPVYISSEDSPLFLEQGKTTARKHKHYKVKFISCNKKIDGKCLWMPEDIVDPIPSDMLGDPDES